MFKTISAAMVVLVVQSGNVLAATPYPIYPTEGQYIRYEIELSQFFSSAGIDASKYSRTSDRGRRHDGQILCSMLTAYSIEEYLGGELERYRLLYSGTQRLKTESVYSLGVAAAAIDTICTEHRASLMDFMEKYRQR